MLIFKKHLFKATLLLILLAAAFLGVYSVWHYDGTASTDQSTIRHADSIPSDQNRPADMQKQAPRGQGIDQQAGRVGPNVAAPSPNTNSNAASSSNRAPQLLIYAVIFLILFMVAYYLFIYKKLKIDPSHAKILILTLLGVGLFLRISAATLMAGHPFDISTFKSWATAAANNLFQVYSTSRSSDYPPLYMYVLYIVGKIASIPVMNSYYTLLLKLPSIIADIATSYLIFKLARKYLSLELCILVSAFYIFNPAVIINSTFWGQVDSFFTLIVVGALYMLAEKRIGLASVLFTAAVLMKPQGIIFLPVLFFELVRQKNIGNFIKSAAIALGTAAIIVLPFSWNKGLLWIFQLFAKTVGEYPYASVNAFNLFSLMGANYKSDAANWLLLSYHSWGLIFIVLITAFSWFIYLKGNSSAFIPAIALLQIAGVFTLSTSMHERYLFPAAALAILAFIYLRDKRLLFLAVGFSTTIYINTHVVLFGTIQGINSIASPVLIITSLLNVLLLVYLMTVLLDLAVKKKTLKQELGGIL